MLEQKNWFFILLVVLFRIVLGFSGIMLFALGSIISLGTMVSTSSFDIVFWFFLGFVPLVGGGFLVYKSSFARNGVLNPFFWHTLSADPSYAIKLHGINKNSKISTKNKEAFFHQVFYELLEINHGKITALNLAIQSNKSGIKMNGKEANKFLVDISKEFNHKIELGEDGEVVYCFEYLSQVEINNFKKVDQKYFG